VVGIVVNAKDGVSVEVDKRTGVGFGGIGWLGFSAVM
jgi:hypothetical protein